jgi:transcriptional regulator with XRE-family HTH domain
MAEINKGHYHYGITIKEARNNRGMTQQELAEKWPKAEKTGGGEGVNWKYVQDIERGRKHIEDIGTLRKLCELLDIPLWRVGLSEYDPFNLVSLPGRGRSMYDETLDVAESLIRQIWSLRCAARLDEAEKGVKRLNNLFVYFEQNLPPPVRLQRRFQLLYVQVQRLNAATSIEGKQYGKAIYIYTEICESVRNLGDASATAIALKSLGKELERKGMKQEAVSLLEEARDASFGASKQVMAFVHSYLARVYASAGDEFHFERAVDTGLTIAHSLDSAYDDGSDFVYAWKPISATLAEQSWGYLAVGAPHKTLAMRDEIDQQIIRDKDARLHTWIPLDWARAYLMLGKIEESIEEAREFYRRAKIMQSPHAISQTYKLLKELEDAGYGSMQVVSNFRDELMNEK